MPKTINTYSASELKKLHPEGFESALEYWQNNQTEIFWQDDIMKSLKQCFKNAGIELRDWEISDSSQSWVKFSIPTYWSELAACDLLVDNYTGKKAENWLKETFEISKIKKVNFVEHNGKKNFRYDLTKINGDAWDCEFTGYCADCDFIFSLITDIRSGYTLEEAFLNLANCASNLFILELEDQRSEEYFLDFADANGFEFLENGKRL